jgi:hypothetical protein
MLMTLNQSARLTEPSVDALRDPEPFVASQFACVFVVSQFVVVPVRHDQLDAAFAKPLAQRIEFVSAVGEHALWLLLWSALGSEDFDFGKPGLRERNIPRRGSFQPNSHWNTAAVNQNDPLSAVATLAFSNRRAPFFAGAKLTSRTVSSDSKRLSPSSGPE